MALIPETGAGLADANSLCSVGDADAYHDGRESEATWEALTQARKEQALRDATEYMAGYGPRWQGLRVSGEQALDWPRAGVTAHGFAVRADLVPRAVRDACALLAFKSLTGPLLRDQTGGPAKVRTKIGPIETEYAQGVTAGPQFPAVAFMLAPFFSNRNPYAVKLERN